MDQLKEVLLQKFSKPLHVVPVMSPSSSAPSSASSASPPLTGRKREPNSPEESQSKRARLSPDESHPKNARLSPEIQALLEKAVKNEVKTEPHDELNETDSSILTPLPSGPVSEETIFCNVPGRLAILNANTKYSVCVGEIKRRLGNPERLNTSVMGGILRRAKAKNGGKELRELLEGMGLDLPMGKRKAIAMTLFTPMVEGEALHLARDFDHLCTNEFPTEIVADHLNEQQSQEDKSERKKKLEATSSILNEFKTILEQDRSPLLNMKQETILPQQVQDALTHFSMCTHGFGTPALLAATNVVIRVVDLCLSKSNETETQQNAMQAFYLLTQLIQAQALANQANQNKST